MGDHKDAVPLDERGHGHHHDDHGHGGVLGHHHDDHGHSHYGDFRQLHHRPEGFFTHFRAAPYCFFIANIILLALTAQIFQKVVFAGNPNLGVLPPPTCDFCNTLSASCMGSNTNSTNPTNSTNSANSTSSTSSTSSTGSPCGASNNTACTFNSLDDGAACVNGNNNFQCWSGMCLAVDDNCFGQVCRTPPDPQCTATINGVVQGSCSGGKCKYTSLSDGTRCTAPKPLAVSSTGGTPATNTTNPNNNSTNPNNNSTSNGNTTAPDNGNSTNNGNGTALPITVGVDVPPEDAERVLRGWTCQEGVCASQTRNAVSNFALVAAIQAGIIGSALALEKIITGTFTPDLAAFAINAGLIVIGWAARAVDTGLESNSGLGRTQAAFCFIAGAFAVLYGNYLLSTVRPKIFSRGYWAVAVILLVFWLVAFGLVSTLLSELFDHMDTGIADTGANPSFNWAYPATIMAASVNLALAHTLFRTGTYTSGFAAFAAITGVIALAWASQHHDRGEWTVTGEDFTDTVLAWESFAIIAGAISLICGLALAFKAERRKVDGEGSETKVGRFGALIIILVFFTLIGFVAALFVKEFLIREGVVYGNDMRMVGGDLAPDVREENFGNQVSPFAWDFSVWTSAVAAAFGIEVLFHGWGSGGITALTLTQSANLVGWAAQHTRIGSVRPKFRNLDDLTRAWEGLALVAGILTAILAFYILSSRRDLKPDGAPVVVHQREQGVPMDDRQQTLGEEDQNLFKTGGKR